MEIKKTTWHYIGPQSPMLGIFCNMGQEMREWPKSPLGSLEVFICGESSPKFQMYNEQMLIML